MFLKKMIWLIPLVSEHFVHCRRAGVDNSHYHNIASDFSRQCCKGSGAVGALFKRAG